MVKEAACRLSYSAAAAFFGKGRMLPPSRRKVSKDAGRYRKPREAAGRRRKEDSCVIDKSPEIVYTIAERIS